MRKSLFVTNIILALSFLLCKAADAQIRNASFEDRNRAPVQRSNIGPLQAGYPYPTPDLVEWYHPGQVPGGNATGIDDSPDYIASDGTTYVNPVTYYSTIYGPQYSGFSAHSGISCVQIGQSESTGVHGQDEFITQELTQPLTAGNTYHVAFWALREPGAAVHTKLALSITDGNPIFDFNNNTLLPSPGTKVIVSGDIQQRYTWTKVEGDITIPANEPNNKWLTIGFDRSDQIYDSQAQDDYPIGGLGYAIDDVSLVDMGCAPNLMPQYSLSYTDNCIGRYIYDITNYNAAYTYTVQIINGFSGGGVNTRGGKGTFELARLKKATSGTFTVTATYAGCGGGNTATSPPTTVTFPSVLNCRQVAVTENVAVAEEEAITAPYPNPASEMMFLPQGVKQVILLNSKGQTVLQAEGVNKLDVRNLPDGLYNLRMWKEDKVVNQHIEIQH